VSETVQGRLQAYYAAAFPDRQGVQVGGLTRINAGWESDVYAFVAEYGPAGARQRKELILRIYPGNDAYHKSAREFHGMRQLRRAGYPVPGVLLLERECSPFGQPFLLMEKIQGQEMWPSLFRSLPGKQRTLLTLFCELFVQLHDLDRRPFVDDAAGYDVEGAPYVLVDRFLSMARSFLMRFSKPDFLPILEWLEARRGDVPCARPSVVHLDFHPANILLRDDGSAVVLDWTQVGVSDARFDLAWTLLLVGAYEGTAWRERVLREYERLAGNPVEQLGYFDVAACLKRLLSVVVSLSDGAEELGMRPGAEAVMKAQIGALHVVYDLLLERTGIWVAEVERLFVALS